MIDGQVYSLATRSNERLNMNIVTYVTAVSMKPKRYSIALYHGSQSLKNMMETATAILQFLSVQHLPLINSLGKRSGTDYDKEAYLKRKDWLEQWKGYTILKETTAIIALKKIEQISAGDHELFIYDVERYQTFSDRGNLLRLDHLREKQIISI